MPKEFRTEADRLATPRPVPPKGVCFTAPRGQKRRIITSRNPDIPDVLLKIKVLVGGSCETCKNAMLPRIL